MDDSDWTLISELRKTKNLTQTAEKLFISQPTVTKKIKQIENELNIKIYERESAGVTFTRQGEYLADEAAEIISELEYTKENVKNLKTDMVGKLNIGVSNHFAKYDLPQILSGFKEKYPLVEFNIQSGYGNEMIKMMNEENIHIGLIRSSFQWYGSKIKLNEDPMCLVSTSKILMDDLPHLSRIKYRTGTNTGVMIENWWQNNFSEPPLIGMTVDSVEGCKEMVVYGHGYAILPESIIQKNDDLYKEKLKNPDGSNFVVDSWLYYIEPLLENKVISEFVNYIKEKYKGVNQ